MATQTIGVRVGNTIIGGNAPVSIQSMTTTDTRDVAATVAQIQRLERAGCDIVRVAVVDEQAAAAIREIKKRIRIPVIADIQFDHALAILAVEAGADKLRINPGNIGGEQKIREVVASAIDHKVPIRIGVNSGSLHSDMLQRYGGPTPEAMVESAMIAVGQLEAMGFNNIVLSIKASSVRTTIAAYRAVAKRLEYPLHLGVTEAGYSAQGLIKSAIGIGALLADGIGSTIRVSLTGDPVKEVKAGFLILRSLGLRNNGLEIISCPTCGRCRVELEDIIKHIESNIAPMDKHIRLAIMGCVVNGPGEAREADIGIAFGETGAVVFQHGQKLFSAPINDAIDALVKTVNQMAEQ